MRPGRPGARAQAPLTEPTDPVKDSRLASVLRRVRPGKRRPPILTVLRDPRTVPFVRAVYVGREVVAVPLAVPLARLLAVLVCG